jgi:hypothetical protein
MRRQFDCPGSGFDRGSCKCRVKVLTIPRQKETRKRAHIFRFSVSQCKLDDVRQYGKIYVGRHDTRKSVDDGAEAFRIVEDMRHPSFNENVCCGFYQGLYYNGVKNDFMIFKLSGQSSKPVISLNSNSLVPRPEEELHVIGFGDTDSGNAVQKPNRLHEVTVNYETNAECSQNSIYPDHLLHSSSMCARDYKEDACNGKSSCKMLVGFEIISYFLSLTLSLGIRRFRWPIIDERKD